MSNSSKSIPFVVIALVAFTLMGEYFCECTIDLETYLPLLISLGLAGVPLKVVRDAISAKKAIDTEKFRQSLNRPSTTE